MLEIKELEGAEVPAVLGGIDQAEPAAQAVLAELLT